MIITNSDYNTLPEQVQENTENIQTLASKIKNLYFSKLALTQETTTIAISNIKNWTTGVTSGYVVDISANVFEIVGVTDTLIYINWLLEFEGQRGQQGETGNGIESIKKTSSSGLVDTYTITFTNGGTQTFEITNGEQGEQGASGVAELTEVNLQYGQETVTYDTTDGITISSSGAFKSNGVTSYPNVEMNIPLVGSEEIIFDATENGDKVQAHLDNSVSNKLANALTLPVTTPTDTQLVAVNSSKAQTMLQVGEGLSVENGILSAMSSGSEQHLYKHFLEIFLQFENVFTTEIVNGCVYKTVYTTDSESYTTTELNKGVSNLNLIDINVNLTSKSGNTFTYVAYLNLKDATVFYNSTGENASTSYKYTDIGYGTITDTVTQIF